MGLSHQNEDQLEEDRNDDVASNYDEYENAEGVDYHASYYDMGLDDATVKVREKIWVWMHVIEAHFPC